MSVTPAAPSLPPTKPSPGLDSAGSPRRAWTSGQLLLAAQLALARQPEVRQTVSALYADDAVSTVAERAALLDPLLRQALGDSAAGFAAALGLETREVLRFVAPGHPASTAVELRGRLGSLRALDRVWGGTSHTVCLEAASEISFEWPGPRPGQMSLLRGAACAAGTPVWPWVLAKLPVGTVFELAPGALVALRRFPVAALVEAARVAEFNVAALIEDLCGNVPTTAIATKVGMLSLEGPLLHLKDRLVRLADAERRLLLRLAEKPGYPVSRHELARAVGAQRHRSLDKLVAELRDKLGDGVVATVYGEGYALEIE